MVKSPKKVGDKVTRSKKTSAPKARGSKLSSNTAHHKEAPIAVSGIPTLARDYVQAVGRRKSAVARLRLFPRGNGSITVNARDYRQYFPYTFYQETVTEPLPLVGMNAAVMVSVKVTGGGLHAQAEAVRLALARALIIHNPDWRPALRKMGWLTRDPREKERKKPGLKRARRAPQWQKR